ncbi:MAG: polysaccharide deacetylase family protein [Syntrophobacteraceae bacterium]
MITDLLVGPSILMYHSIVDSSDDPYAVSVGAFREQIRWLSEHGFEVVPLSILVRSIQTRKKGNLRKKVVITFDDGYKDFLDNALPILLSYRAPATVFLVTDLLGGRASWNESGMHAPLLSEDEVRCIKARGISLGSHTATHVNLPLLNREEMRRQLRDSHNRLTLLGETFYALSYPWGQWSRQVVDTVKASGYECATVVGEQTGFTADAIYLLPRITMTRNMDLRRFQSLLKRTLFEMELRRRYRKFRENKLGVPS